MATACAPFTQVVTPPVSATKNFVNNTPKTEMDLTILRLTILSFNNLLNDVRSYVIIKMSKEEAQQYLATTASVFKEMPKIESALYGLQEGISKEWNELLPLIKNMWSNLKEMIEEVKMIASREDIDENSETYKDFLVKITERELESGKPTYGKKSLMDLFE